MGRAQRADARRNYDRLVEVAGEHFAREGIDAPLERIARDADVGIGTLYRHFPTRDALVEAVYRHNVTQLAERADDLLAELPPGQALSEWMQLFVSYVATKKGLATHLKSVVSADSDLFAYTHGVVESAIRKLVEAAVAGGDIRSDVEPMDLLRAMSGVCLIDAPGWQAQARRITALLVDGLRYRAAATT